MKKLNRLRRMMVVWLSVILFIIVSTTIILVQAGRLINEYTSEMPEVLKNTAYCYQLQKKLDSDSEWNQKNKETFLTEQISAVVEKIDLDEMKKADLTGVLEGANVFVFDKVSAIEVALGEAKAKKLIEEGIYTEKDAEYGRWTCNSFSGGYFVINWKPESEKEKMKRFAQAAKGETIAVISKETGEIIDSNNEESIGENYKTYFHVENTLFEGESDKTGFRYTNSNSSAGKIGIYGEYDAKINDVFFAAHLSYNCLVEDTLHLVVPQLLMMALVYLMAVRYALMLFKHRLSRKEPEGSKRIFGKLTMDIRFISHIGAFLVFGIIIAVSLTLYLQTLINYSVKNTQADDNLRNAAELVEQSALIQSANEKIQIDYYTTCMQGIANLAVFSPSLLEQEHLNEAKLYFRAKLIMVLDENGYCILSSNGASGFSLSNTNGGENGTDYSTGIFFNGAESTFWEEGDNIYIAVQRKEEKGSICMQISKEAIQHVDAEQNTEKAMIYTCFNQGDKLFVRLDHPEILYVIAAGKEECQKVTVSLDESLLSGNFTGQTHLNHIWYYVNELRKDDILYISGLRRSTEWFWILSGIALELIGFGILMFILTGLLTFHVTEVILEEVNESEEKKQLEIGPERKKMMISLDQLSDKTFRKMMNRLLIYTVVIMGIYIMFEIRYYSGSVFLYLFSSKWERKLNLFSVTMILLFALGAKIGNAIVRRVILLIAANVGSRGVTIGHMICSLLQFGTLVAWILYTIVEFGMKLSYLLTGAGVIGLVIGYACQGVINDLLSGLFLVFEGNFQVGDWISVGEWRGEVKEIGVRTTKVARAGDVRIFNNSCLNTVTVWSGSMSGALCSFSVDYGTDLDLVMKLILENEKNYREVCPHIVAGPGIHGVTELGDSGITIRIWASIDDQNFVGITERTMLQETKRLFDEKGITIPFPQMVLHHVK